MKYCSNFHYYYEIGRDNKSTWRKLIQHRHFMLLNGLLLNRKSNLRIHQISWNQPLKTKLKLSVNIAIFQNISVTSTYKEPLRSWIDNLYGPMGAIVGAGTGLLRTFHLDEEKIADLIPGDFVANGVLAAAYNNQFNE